MEILSREFRRQRIVSGNRGASRKSHQTIFDRVDDQLRGFVKAESVHDVGAMDGNGVDAEAEFGGNFLVGFAGDNVLEDFELARSEAGVALALEIAGEGDLRIENGFALGDFLDGGDEVEIHGVFENVAAGAGFERLADERVFGMHAEHEDGDVGKFGMDAAGGFDAVDLREGAIHNDYFGLKLFGELNGFEA